MSTEHDHTHAPLSFNSAFAFGIVLNMVFVAVESFYGWQVNSLALLADAGHNLSDVAGLVLAWGGTLAVKLKPNPRHTYGWKRATILAAFANALLLLVAMGGLAWEAIGRLVSSQPVVEAQGITIMVVASVGIVINTATALLFMRGRDSDLNIRGAFMHMAADALVSAGVVVVGALSFWMAWTWLDPVVSLIIAGIILIGTWGLFKQSLHMLFDGVPDSVDPAAVHDFLVHLPGVSQVNDLHIWAMGTSHIAMTAHLVMPHGNTDDAFLQSATEQMHDRFDIRHVTLQVMQRPFSAGCVEQSQFGCEGSHEMEQSHGHQH